MAGPGPCHGMKQRSRPTEQPSSSLLHPPEAQRLLAAAAADAAAPRAEFLFAPPAALHKPLAALLEDSRDLPVLFLYLNVALTTAPAALALFCAFPPATRPLPHWLGAAYLIVNYALYLARFMLSLHYSQHRRLFRKGELTWGQAWLCSGLCSTACSISWLWRLYHGSGCTCLQASLCGGCPLPQICGPSTWWRLCCWPPCLASHLVRTAAAAWMVTWAAIAIAVRALALPTCGQVVCAYDGGQLCLHMLLSPP